jgi:hypothetical protein
MSFQIRRKIVKLLFWQRRTPVCFSEHFVDGNCKARLI